MPGDEAECTGRQANGDVAIALLVVEDGPVDRDRGIGAERQVGGVDHHQPRRAVGAGAHGLVAQHRIADIDLAAARSGDANDFVLDDGSFADARRRLRRGGAEFAEAQIASAARMELRQFISHRTICAVVLADCAGQPCCIVTTSPTHFLGPSISDLQTQIGSKRKIARCPARRKTHFCLKVPPRPRANPLSVPNSPIARVAADRERDFHRRASLADDRIDHAGKNHL